MPIFSVIAIYFVIWWLTLFVVLPVGLRTQAEEQDVVRGSTESAPARFSAWKVFGATTLLAALIQLGFTILSDVYGIGIDSIPRFAPTFY
ncbi:hypothetical protein BJF92_01640 [Rhizobium rhizosphaerae]|uniref:Uncharacterized protein n=1 Tax=Xaviernesmea rhizosphaerae TaxID=1672749 RepID=A0A1Q9AKL1_9HYPH|nr:DUF1467 family protein [Xaviernesmea rhizosphaerae]OLP55846.1 hypothetical protein BJF92_01640 [Xaviernesmea rhizosphaerae]OQP85578.1 hypothetical protein BTR14_15445 [Xaviernesmea rhizosphaerae]